MDGAVVRSAEPEDAANICALTRRVVESAVDPSLRDGILDNVEANVAVWLASPSRCVHLVAPVDAFIVGVILVKDFWNLCSLFVAPECHGRGIGKALVRAAVAQCAGRSPKSALLLNAYPGAVGFYEQLGFMPQAPQSSPSGIRAMKLPL